MSRSVSKIFQDIQASLSVDAAVNKELYETVRPEGRFDRARMGEFYNELMKLAEAGQMKVITNLSVKNQLAIRSYELWRSASHDFAIFPEGPITLLHRSVRETLNLVFQQYIIEKFQVKMELGQSLPVIDKLREALIEEKELIRKHATNRVKLDKDSWVPETKFGSTLRSFGSNTTEKAAKYNELCPNGRLLFISEIDRAKQTRSILGETFWQTASKLEVTRSRCEHEFHKALFAEKDASTEEKSLLLGLLCHADVYVYFSVKAIDSWVRRYNNHFEGRLDPLIKDCFPAQYDGPGEWEPVAKSIPNGFARHKGSREHEASRKDEAGDVQGGSDSDESLDSIPDDAIAVPCPPLSTDPECWFQANTDDIDLLLLLLRATYNSDHHPSDLEIDGASYGIQQPEGICSDEQTAHVFSVLEQEQEPKQDPLPFCFKQLPILSNENKHLLKGWLAAYSKSNAILYGVVNIGVHWVPVLIIKTHVPYVVTLEPMHMSEKAECVRSLMGFFKDALGVGKFEYLNLPVVAQYNGKPCGIVSIAILEEIFATLRTAQPIVELDAQGFKFYPDRLSFNGLKDRITSKRHKKDFYRRSFLEKIDAIVKKYVERLSGFGKAQLALNHWSEGDFERHRATACSQFYIYEGEDIAGRIQEQFVRDLRKQLVDALFGLAEHPYQDVFVPVEYDFIEALITKNNLKDATAVYLQEPKLEFKRRSLLDDFNLALQHQWCCEYVDSKVLEYITTGPGKDGIDEGEAFVWYCGQPKPEHEKGRLDCDEMVERFNAGIRKRKSSRVAAGLFGGSCSSRREPVIQVNEEKARLCIAQLIAALEKGKGAKSTKLFSFITGDLGVIKSFIQDLKAERASVESLIERICNVVLQKERTAVIMSAAVNALVTYFEIPASSKHKTSAVCAKIEVTFPIISARYHHRQREIEHAREQAYEHQYHDSIAVAVGAMGGHWYG